MGKATKNLVSVEDVHRYHEEQIRYCAWSAIEYHIKQAKLYLDLLNKGIKYVEMPDKT